MKPVPWCASVVTVLAALAGPARADKHSTELAKRHYVAAGTLYHAARYRRAADELLTAYAMEPDPELLLYAGQCHRKLGDLSRALELYERYLSLAPRHDPWRSRARELIVDVSTRRLADPADCGPGDRRLCRGTGRARRRGAAGRSAALVAQREPAWKAR